MSAPLFYENAQPVSPDLLAERRLLPGNTWRFANKANSVALTVSEFMLAARDMPIVFSEPQDDDMQSCFPVAILGYRPGVNQFVDAKTGRWVGDYIPAYLRRYPFTTATVPNSDRMILAVSMDEERIGKPAATRGELLYNEGEATEVLQECQDFCTRYHEQTMLTREFVKQLVKYDLLEGKTASLELGSGDKHNLRGFMVVAEDRLAKLPDRAIVALQRQGFLSAIHFHLQSFQAWQRILA